MRLWNRLRGGAMAIVAVMAAMAFSPQAAHAVTAANATIKNVVTVSYGDGAGFTATATATNFVIVDLKTAAPTLSAPADQTTSPGSSVSYTYTITSNANGPDTFNLSAVSVDANISPPVVDFYSDAGLTTKITSVALGATDVYVNVAVNAAGTTAITVPADQAADGSVNGIVAGDTISIAGNVFTVASVTDNGGPNAMGTSVITVNGNGAVVNLTAGTLIEEQRTFYVAVKSGTLAASGNGTHTVTLTVTSAANTAISASDVTVTTVAGPVLQVDKYSANISTGAAGTGTALAVGGVTYYSGGVVGKPAEKIGYLIVIKNTGAGDAKSVVVTDPIPAYTTYVAGSMQLDPYTGTLAPLTDAIGDNDAGEVNATGREITVYAGFGGTNNGGAYAGGTGGTLPAGKTSYVTFQVTVD